MHEHVTFHQSVVDSPGATLLRGIDSPYLSKQQPSITLLLEVGFHVQLSSPD